MRATRTLTALALLLSLGLHGVIVLGLGFLPMPPKWPPMRILEAVLVGPAEQAAPKAPEPALPNEPSGAPEGAARNAANAQTPPLADGKQTELEQAADVKAASPGPGTDAATAKAPSVQKGPVDYLALREEVAAFGLAAAELARAGGAGPRIHRLSSTSAKSPAEAAYLEMWQRRVQRIGNANYPAGGGQGDLRLQVRIGYDGTLLDARVVESSGIAALDAAALRIVRLAAPFAQFSVDMRKSYDQLEIMRRWRFSRAGTRLAE